MPVFLRKLKKEDLLVLCSLANDVKVANGMTTLAIPFKEEDGMALIARSASDNEVILGIVVSASDKLAGVVILRDFEPSHEQAEMSVWIGEEYWGKGYATEAIRQMTRLGFGKHGLNRIYAYCMVRNIGSQRILEKAGYFCEGLLRERVIKNGIYEDVYIYARLKKDQDVLS